MAYYDDENKNNNNKGIAPRDIIFNEILISPHAPVN